MSIRDYKITDEQFNEKGMTSLPDTLNGTPYENKKSLEKFTREVVAPQFNAIVEVFAQMEDSTHNWSAEEAQRVQQENARQSAEQGRVSAEGQRATNETARLLAEENRISAENDRVTAETARVNAENKRDSAEKSRASAETARQSAETARNIWEAYDAAKTYVPGNKVSFNGSSYVCTAATTGHAPTDTAYWLLIAQKGADGKGAGDMLASVYDPKGRAQDVFQYADTKASAAQSAAAAYTDNKIKAIPTPDVSGQISAHNAAADAHAALFRTKAPAYTCGTADLTAGTSPLESGVLYFVYE